MMPSFWHKRRVLVTGHTGFKGSWLSLLLQQLGAEVTGLALAPATTPALFDDAAVADGMESRIGNINDGDLVSQTLRESNPEIILHLAAQAIVSESYTQPLETLQTNIMGTARLLECARNQPGIRAIVIVTTDKCYENREWLWGYRENDALGGKDIYSSSKACAELVTASYRHAFFDKPDSPVLATARAGNVIGGGDWATDRLLPDMVRAFTAGRPALIRSPSSVRPWQHVLEPLHGYLRLARLCCEDRQFGRAWNFGPELADAAAVATVADRVVNLWGEGAAWHAPAGNPLKESHTLRLDSSQARLQLNWQPRTGLDQALALTVAWYRGWAAGDDPAQLTRRQIAQYMAGHS
ncbi:MAG: CDP-glucose 4,6-dehydratase [Pseudomonadota bacterium]|jgi:CDP-glucose 4,6-dehydratase